MHHAGCGHILSLCVSDLCHCYEWINLESYFLAKCVFVVQVSLVSVENFEFFQHTKINFKYFFLAWLHFTDASEWNTAAPDICRQMAVRAEVRAPTPLLHNFQLTLSLSPFQSRRCQVIRRSNSTIFFLSKLQLVENCSNMSLMRFKPRTSCVGSDCSTNLATTTTYHKRVSAPDDALKRINLKKLYEIHF